MADTTIEWTNKTWNPTTGCSKKSRGCKHCYAERLFPRVYPGRAFTDVQYHPERLDAPLHWRKPQMVFVNSMSDLFHEKVPEASIAAVFAHMAVSHWHTFQVLTKTSDRMRELLNSERFCQLYEDELQVAQLSAEQALGARGEFDPNARRTDDIRAFEPAWPLKNVQLGVSCEDQEWYEKRHPDLCNTPAAVRFLSVEPMLGPIVCRFDLIEIGLERDGQGSCALMGGIDWVIAGGESGPRARAPHPGWFRNLRDECQAAGVPFFFKQWGQWAPPEELPASSLFRRSRHTYVETAGEKSAYMLSIGKKLGGRFLEGRTWDEFPRISL